jgi:tetratricopeptide (TPR) repeat protein
MTKKKTSAQGTKSNAAPQAAAVQAIGAQAAPASKVADAIEPPSASELQLKSYEHAIQLFSQRKLPEARARFLEAVKGPAASISDKARTYIQVCERRTAEVAASPTLTAEDHFNHGVERLNARDVERAKHHFGRALLLEPQADHILYTMALCCGLAGDGNGACENLRRAIDVEPRNRILARQDPEFLALASQFPTLRALLDQGIF